MSYPIMVSWQMGSEHLEDPAMATAAGDPLPADCDGEIDWTLFTFTHGFRQPRSALGTAPVRRNARAASSGYKDICITVSATKASPCTMSTRP